MRTTDYIWLGKKCSTFLGYDLITGYNGHIVSIISYEIEDDGYEKFDQESTLTLSEIGSLMKEMDGRNHKVGFLSTKYMSWDDKYFDDVLKGEFFFSYELLFFFFDNFKFCKVFPFFIIFL